MGLTAVAGLLLTFAFLLLVPLVFISVMFPGHLIGPVGGSHSPFG